MSISQDQDVAQGAGSETLYGAVTDRLRQLIISGEIRPGTHLRIVEAASRFGVSAQPVREAIQTLQGEGLVEVLPNRGAFVRGIDAHRLRGIYEMREAIESFMAGRFAEEAALSDIRQAETMLDRHEAAISAEDWIAADRANLRFHEHIVMHSRNEEAIALRRRYMALTTAIRHRVGYSSARWDTICNDHRALIDAFRRRDAVAAQAIAARHVRDTRDETILRLGAELG